MHKVIGEQYRKCSSQDAAQHAVDQKATAPLSFKSRCQSQEYKTLSGRRANGSGAGAGGRDDGARVELPGGQDVPGDGRHYRRWRRDGGPLGRVRGDRAGARPVREPMSQSRRLRVLDCSHTLLIPSWWAGA